MMTTPIFCSLDRARSHGFFRRCAVRPRPRRPTRRPTQCKRPCRRRPRRRSMMSTRALRTQRPARGRRSQQTSTLGRNRCSLRLSSSWRSTLTRSSCSTRFRAIMPPTPNNNNISRCRLQYSHHRCLERALLLRLEGSLVRRRALLLRLLLRRRRRLPRRSERPRGHPRGHSPRARPCQSQEPAQSAAGSTTARRRRSAARMHSVWATDCRSGHARLRAALEWAVERRRQRRCHRRAGTTRLRAHGRCRLRCRPLDRWWGPPQRIRQRWRRVGWGFHRRSRTACSQQPQPPDTRRQERRPVRARRLRRDWLWEETRRRTLCR
mmetsp:Transcript_11410/g.24592  ORF Transcript_11410/g.24592 Transcript_11410/m.24592 type:complete len:322 (+) Transcript_11410:156-1121(+)